MRRVLDWLSRVGGGAGGPLQDQTRFMPPTRARERLLFRPADGQSYVLVLTPVSRGVCVASFVGGAAEGGACPAGVTIRQQFGAVPFTAEMGGHVLVTPCPFWLVDCGSGAALTASAVADDHEPARDDHRPPLP